MDIRIEHIIFTVFLYIGTPLLVHCQDTSISNNTFISSFWFLPCHNEIFSRTSTVDGGFAFIKGIAAKELKNNHEFIGICCNCDATKIKTVGGATLHKANRKGEIEWIKYLGEWAGSGFISQTKDKGFVLSLNTRIVKTDSLGEIVWNLDFKKDSITQIKKSKFLENPGISCITECSDGSYIALLQASFSLLKISNEGKALWLKSTLFEDFDPMYFDYYSKYDSTYLKRDSIGINSLVWHMGGYM